MKELLDTAASTLVVIGFLTTYYAMLWIAATLRLILLGA